jgi:hypothetical protein
VTRVPKLSAALLVVTALSGCALFFPSQNKFIRLSGVVTNEAGTPVHGATIKIWFAPSDLQIYAGLSLPILTMIAPGATIRTGEDGRFDGSVQAFSRYRIQVQGADGASSDVVIDKRGATKPLTFVLTAPNKI